MTVPIGDLCHIVVRVVLIARRMVERIGTRRDPVAHTVAPRFLVTLAWMTVLRPASVSRFGKSILPDKRTVSRFNEALAQRQKCSPTTIVDTPDHANVAVRLGVPVDLNVNVVSVSQAPFHLAAPFRTSNQSAELIVGAASIFT